MKRKQAGQRVIRVGAGLFLAGVMMAAAAAEDRAGGLGLPFSDAVRAGDLLFISGQLGNLPGTLDLAPGGMPAQAKQAMDNIRAIVEANGLGMQDIVKCTVMLADMAQWADFNQVYIRYFPGRKPARSAFGAAALAMGAALEVECIASYPTTR